MRAGLSLKKNVLTALAKRVLLSLGGIAEAPATDAAIQKKIQGSGTTALIFSNENLGDIIKIVQSVQVSRERVLVKQLKMK